ncbi:hypothetical protein [Pontibacter cellulosilyticus]|uniref:Uncharacterized protein n=1 Tax=Pontibacter cellulosilyticus TaxID=1720253 RepID=A0A923N8Q0_9BACT|nr:hypothetical protein [Pontibacter cellulosilyticus]MBC5993794.1 hypothetical protein [Pontibacter cellulosilyticus]
MKKLFLLVLALGCFLSFSEAQAQSSAQSSTKSKDEYWGTSKVQTKGSSADAVGRRGQGLDKRYNEYEDDRGSRRKSFEKKKIAKSKKMKEILKKEEEMMKKHKRDKKRLKRQQKRRN